MALLSLENAQSVDLTIYIVGFIAYLILVWVPVISSACIVRFYQPVVEFRIRGWKFKRQYIYLEIWYRTHVILGGSFLVVVFAEPWDWGTRVGATIVVLVLCIILRKVARYVHGRVPGSYALRQDISKAVRSHATSRGDMKEWMATHHAINQSKSNTFGTSQQEGLGPLRQTSNTDNQAKRNTASYIKDMEMAYQDDSRHP